MEDFISISLYNIIYKTMSKAIANRLKRILPNIITPSQNVFVVNRNIQDNSIIAYELMHFFWNKRKWNEGFVTLKMDICKAYNKLEWNYIAAVFTKMGFDHRWISLF